MGVPTPSRNIVEGELLWTPSAGFAHNSQLARFERWLGEHRALCFADYDALWRWTITDPDAYWSAFWEYFAVHSTTPYDSVRSGNMPRTRWFSGARVNFTEHLLRYEATAGADEVAIYHSTEIRPPATVTWTELGADVRALTECLRSLGIVPGDRVVSYMPNVPETAIAMMATTAIGAIWSSAAQEFGVQTVLDRFAQIEPKLIFAADGYGFGGKTFGRHAELAAIVAGLPTLRRLIWLPYVDAQAQPPPGVPSLTWAQALEFRAPARDAFVYAYVGEDDPLWILFSSGTTGLPKAIVHSHVGILLELLKSTAFNANLGPGSRLFFFSTTGWMMWNFLVSGLLQGAAIVLYDGHPAYPEPDLLWKLAAAFGVTMFGASPTYVQQMQKHGLVPRVRFDLSALESIFLAGSPATPETFAWFYANVKADLWVTSQSGGTDFCAGIVGSVPTLPVYAGEIQGRLLGMDVHAWNAAGEDLIDEVGELVITQPTPSMPLYFWNDAGDDRYRESYFSTYPGVWRHGDFLKINHRGGCFVYGRSDSTLNRYGVRIGTSEIYRCVERLDAVVDSLIIGLERPGGGFYMPLFVKLKPGGALDDTLRDAINLRLRTDCSPRHAPDEIHAVPDIPYTLSAKKIEVPIRRILRGEPVETVIARDAMLNPAALDWFVTFAESVRARVGR